MSIIVATTKQNEAWNIDFDIANWCEIFNTQAMIDDIDMIWIWSIAIKIDQTLLYRNAIVILL